MATVLSGGWALSAVDPGVAPGSTVTVENIVANPEALLSGVAFRVKDTANFWAVVQAKAFGGWIVYKVVNGAVTQVTTAAIGTCCARGDRMQVAYGAGGVLLYLNGALIWSSADSALASETKGGVFSSTTGSVSSGFAMATGVGAFTHTWHDLGGRPTMVMGPASTLVGYSKSTMLYDASSRPTVVTRPDGSQVKTSYYPSGRLHTQTDAKNAVTSYAWDALGRPSSVTPPGKPATTYSYAWTPGQGVTSTVARPGGATVTTTADAAGRPVHVDYSGATPDVTLGYDALGRRVSMQTGGQADSWTYDSLGNLTQSVRGSSTVSFEHNEAGQTTKVTYPNGQAVTNAFANGYWSSTADWAGKTFTATVDVDGNVTNVAYPNGTATARVFDGDGMVSAISTTKGPATLAKWDYVRNTDSGVASVASTGTAGAGTNQSFSYDGLPRLTKVTDATTPANTAAYGYDVADNPTTLGATAQAFNPANELCWTAPKTAAGANRACGTPAAGATDYSYSATGNRTAKTPASGTATSYGHDGADRLTSITGAVSATYSYDGDGLRIAKNTGGVSSSFGWNDESGIALLLRDRNDYYVYGPDGVPLERLGSSSTLYLHTDQQDSIRLATDIAGNAACTASYTPWGAVTWTSKPGYTGPTPNLGYNSQYTDTETGYIYLRARYYDPTTAQFLTRDPAITTTRSAYGYTATHRAMW